MATDTRVRITKQIIKESFIELLKTNSLNKISVTQICKKAVINRVTFYKYYQDTFDLYEKLIDKLIEESSGSIMKINDRKDLKERFTKSHWQAYMLCQCVSACWKTDQNIRLDIDIFIMRYLYTWKCDYHNSWSQ